MYQLRGSEMLTALFGEKSLQMICTMCPSMDSKDWYLMRDTWLSLGSILPSENTLFWTMTKRSKISPLWGYFLMWEADDPQTVGAHVKRAGRAWGSHQAGGALAGAMETGEEQREQKEQKPRGEVTWAALGLLLGHRCYPWVLNNFLFSMGLSFMCLCL